MSERTGTRITRIRTVGIPVTDQDRALEFYAGTLGFDVVMDGAFGQGERWIELAPPGAGTTIALVRATEGTPTGVDTGIRFSTADAGTDHADLRARGVDADEEILRWDGVPPMFTLRDPDGNRLVVVEEP